MQNDSFYQKIVQNELKTNFYNGQIVFDFQIQFNGVYTNVPTVGCSRIDLFITINVTDYNLLKSGKYNATAFTLKRPVQTTTTTTTTSTTTFTTPTTSLVSNSTILLTNPMTSSGSSTTLDVKNTTESLTTISTTSKTDSTISATVATTIDNFITTKKKSEIDAGKMDNLISSGAVIPSYIDNTFYVILATCLLIFCCISIAIFSLVFYLRKEKQENVEQNGNASSSSLRRGNSFEVNPKIYVNVGRHSMRSAVDGDDSVRMEKKQVQIKINGNGLKSNSASQSAALSSDETEKNVKKSNSAPNINDNNAKSQYASFNVNQNNNHGEQSEKYIVVQAKNDESQYDRVQFNQSGEYIDVNKPFETKALDEAKKVSDLFSLSQNK